MRTQIPSASLALCLLTLWLVSAPNHLRGQAAESGIDANAETLQEVDVVTIVVFGEPSLSGEFQVSKRGSINFPLLGQVDVKGLTSDEVAQRIEKLLETDFIRDAQVSVDLVGRKANSVLVIGQVRRPGQVKFGPDGTMDLFTAIASAGGAEEETSDTSRIEIKRRNGDTIKTMYADLDEQKELQLKDRDTVIVRTKAIEELEYFTVLGEVNKPGTFPLPRERELDILTALALAGGLTQMARPSKVTVRDEEGQSKEVNVGRMQRAEVEPLVVKAGDTIFVPESIF